jgi:hypothetical protein
MRLLAAIVVAAVIVVVGIAVGEALHDNPKPDFTVTHTKTLVP